MVMSLDLETFLENFYAAKVKEQFGTEGLRILADVMKAVRKVYQYIEPSCCNFPIFVFKTVNEKFQPIQIPPTYILEDYNQLVQIIDQECVIQLAENELLHVWKNLGIAPASLSKFGVVYEYNNRIEYFHANNQTEPVPKISPSQASTFALNTFEELVEALENYKMKQVRYCSCPLLQEIWYDQNRIFLKNKPEKIMRKSLTQFLKARLRSNVEVRPEQIVDESHPVDIKVTWYSTNRLALIEIKWLGNSKMEDGRKGQAYRDFRANEGAKQLADYLDANLQQAPVHITRGYLVIIDCRRAKLKEDTITIDEENGIFFRDHEISFEPDYHKKRRDFEKPIRMFVEPICI